MKEKSFDRCIQVDKSVFTTSLADQFPYNQHEIAAAQNKIDRQYPAQTTTPCIVIYLLSKRSPQLMESGFLSSTKTIGEMEVKYISE